MNLRSLFLLFSFFWASNLLAAPYALIDVAYIEPEEGVVKSIYKANTISLGLGYGQDFEQGTKLEGRIARREYNSRLNALESNMRLFELGFDVMHTLGRVPNWFDFFIGFGTKLMLLDIAIEDESADSNTSRTRTTSFAYEYQFGLEVPFPSLSSALRLSIAREHIYKAAFGNFSLDGHIYQASYVFSL